ncbi:MAG: putative cation/proton antiporter YbaL [Gemmatimonadaceae bacterium]|nr:putative cation/proton antiporter YbaL [Gemmatimonadaceae bacterium]
MHEEIPQLRDLVLLIAVALPVIVIATRFHVPSLVGFLLTGIAIGPHALGLVREIESVNTLAQVGAVLLLFAVGLELSLSRIVRLGRLILRGGFGQLVGTTVVVAGVTLLAGTSVNHAILYGALVTLSSTAIILKVYADRGELDSAHGRVVVAILLFQDLCVVPLMVLLPLLAGTEQGLGAIGRAIAITVTVTGGLLLVGRFVIPKALERVVALRSQEIFTLCILAIGLGAAYLTSIFGLSLALGAFVAGLVIAESEFGLQALTDVLPFRDTFSGIFFTSVGMLLDVHYFLAHLWFMLGVAIGIVILKALIGYIVVRVVRRSARVGIIAGIGLAQVGEFSFVLASMAASIGLMGSDQYQLLLGASILTMLIAPFAVAWAPDVAELLLRNRAMPTMEWATREARIVKPLEDHVIIVGYGLNGENLARVLRRSGIRYTILESNGQVVRRARLEREPIVFGDGTRAEVLDRVGIHRARVVVFAIASLGDERRGVAVARQLNPKVHIVARTRYVVEIDELRSLGADEVVPEEFETSIEIFGRVLHRYGIADERIREAAEDAREHHYELLRSRGASQPRLDSVLRSTPVGDDA